MNQLTRLRQKIAAIDKGAATYYNSHGQTTTFADIWDVEVEERENYTDEQFATWAEKYGIDDDNMAIWVVAKPEDVLRYVDDIEEAYTYTDEQGFIIPESDDGDGGFIFVFKKG